jgi:hypothetical protein
VSDLSEFPNSPLHVLAFRAGAVWMASCVHAIPTSINWFGVLFSTPHPIPPLLLYPISLFPLSLLVVVRLPIIRADFRFSYLPLSLFPMPDGVHAIWFLCGGGFSYSFCFCLIILNFFFPSGGIHHVNVFMSSTAVVRIVMMLGFLDLDMIANANF